LSEEAGTPSADAVADADVAAMIDEATRQELQNVRRGLHWILDVLSGDGAKPAAVAVAVPAAARKPTAKATPKPAAPVKKAAKTKKH
jgi:hypothetical protein